MRVKIEKLKFLKEIIEKVLPNCEIYLFGSRVDDSKKGGDIDILIIGDKKLDFKEKAKIEKEFFIKFGEQKIDLVSYKKEEEETFKNLVLFEAIKI